MDIIIINKEQEIINARNLSIKVINNCLVGINERQETIIIEKYESEEYARKILARIGEKLENRYRTGEANFIVIDLKYEEIEIIVKETAEKIEESGEIKKGGEE